MNTRLRVLLVAILCYFAVLPLLAQNPPPAPGPHAVRVESGVRVKMRDGVLLVCDIYRPTAEGRFPVLLTRTPYNRKDPATGMFLASHGYIVVQQDTRGRFDSMGEFYPFRHEASDGYDTVEWAAALPYSDGRVGTYGGSYVGATQLLAASSAPPHLVGIFPYVTASEYYEGWTYLGGALMQWFAESWTSGLAVDTVTRKTSSLNRPLQWAEYLPVDEYPITAFPTPAEAAPYFRDWVQHDTDDEYWGAIRVSDHYGKMNVKALHVGGWHDIFSGGSIRNFLGMQKQTATDEARRGQRLIMGPWAHAATSPEGRIGGVTFGPQAVLDMNPTIVKWYDYVMKGAQNEFASDLPVKIFVMGDNVWRNEREFPLARTSYTRYYLHAVKGAASASGDGTLSTVPPKAERPDAFEYDPASPVRTIGGRLCCGGLPPGPFDQSPNESRADVLVFSTPVLTEDVEVTGFVTLELYAATSAADTDFTAMLVDVDGTGFARYLADGVIRARFRDSREVASPIEPGKIYKYTIDLWATSNVFKSGHRIRVYVTSSNFPRFNRNLNTGEKTFGGSTLVKAKQTIYHDADHPSAVVLPIIPRASEPPPAAPAKRPGTSIIAPGARLERLAGDFQFTEGPTSDRDGNVFFTDQPNNRIMRWGVDGKLSTFLQPAGRANGMYFGARGNLLACADEKTELWSITPDGSHTVLARQFEGKPLNGPNDVWVRPDDGLYFTDPFYKREWWKYSTRPQDSEQVYFLSPDRKTLRRVTSDLVQPNGIIGTPDGKTLFVSDIGAGRTYAYDIQPDGRLVNRRLRCELGSDGMTLDTEGNLYLTGRGVSVFDRNGTKVEQIDVPEPWTANVSFGGKDHRTLFITASKGLYAIRLRVQGANPAK
jgi:uncharacterized protein